MQFLDPTSIVILITKTTFENSTPDRNFLATVLVKVFFISTF